MNPKRFARRQRAATTVVAVAMLALLDTSAGTSLLVSRARAQDAALPEVVEQLLDHPRLPAVATDPADRYLLLVDQHGLLPNDQLRAPSINVAGRRLDRRTGGPHVPIAYFGLTVVDLEFGTRTRVHVPTGATIGFPLWAPDGSSFAFTATTRNGIELWIGDPRTGHSRRLIDDTVNAALGAPCTWMPDSRQLMCRLVPDTRVALPETGGDEVFSHVAAADAPAGSDRDLIRHFLYSQLALIDVETGERRALNQQTVIESVTPAPSGRIFLMTVARPQYSRLGAVEAWARHIEVWNTDAHLLQALPLRDADQPDAIRAAHWQPTAPETLIWVARFGGRERVLAQTAPFLEPATTIFETPRRFSGVEWLEDSSRALVSEYDTTHRITRTWLIDAGDTEAPPRRLGSRSVDAAYPALGPRLSRTNASGHTVVRVDDNTIYVLGQSVQDSYIERVDLESMGTERVWESGEPGHERVIDLLTANGNRLLTRYEAASEPPNYRLHDLQSGAMQALTQRAHPAPELTRITRIPLRYRRSDGVELSSMLYVPRGSLKNGELPLLVWAYPRRYGHDVAPVNPTGTDRFPDAEEAFKLSFVLSGYAILDHVSMPIVGELDDTNDTFVEQVIANAEAALRAAADTGYTDPARAGIAGHSYGAFMVANLLAHSDLFATGIAMSGAYNRTLTPFGFQTERRSLWEARDAYLRMSPYLYSDQIKAPMLLIHGALDDNAGTPPVQSQQLYDAIRFNGGQARLVLLPYEGHTYRGRESVLLTARVMLNWLDDHLRRADRGSAITTAALYDARVKL